MRVLERRRDLIRDANRVLHRELLLALETLVDRLARDERHHVVELPLVLAVVVDREDVRVTEARDDLDLSAESLGSHRERKLAEENLDRDFAIQLRVSGEPDRGHAAAPDFTLETVSASPSNRHAVARDATARESSASHCSAMGHHRRRALAISKRRKAASNQMRRAASLTRIKDGIPRLVDHQNAGQRQGFQLAVGVGRARTAPGRFPGHARRTSRSNLELDDATMRRMGRRVADLVVDHLGSLREQPAQQSLSRPETESLIASAPVGGRTRFRRARGVPRERVFPYHAREPHPHFMGYIPSSPTFPAVLGDWLATGYNFFAGVWPVASGPNQIELAVLDWFRQWLGMPAGTSGLLTSGGSTATLTAVVAARHAADPSGTNSRSAHALHVRPGALVRAARRVDRRHSARQCPVGRDGRSISPARGRYCASDRGGSRRGLRSFLVVASAGTTNTGAVDPLDEIADLCAASSSGCTSTRRTPGSPRSPSGAQRLSAGSAALTP